MNAEVHDPTLAFHSISARMIILDRWINTHTLWMKNVGFMCQIRGGGNCRVCIKDQPSVIDRKTGANKILSNEDSSLVLSFNQHCLFIILETDEQRGLKYENNWSFFKLFFLILLQLLTETISCMNQVDTLWPDYSSDSHLHICQ